MTKKLYSNFELSFDFKMTEGTNSDSDAFKALVKEKYNTIPNFGLGDSGRILLQDHGDEVYFRNVKIKETGNAAKPVQNH